MRKKFFAVLGAILLIIIMGGFLLNENALVQSKELLQGIKEIGA